MAFDKEYISRTLAEERLWKPGESSAFTFNGWELKLEREDDSYAPYLFHVTGKRLGTKDTKNRRYTSMEQAFLHIFNEFNENVAIKNRYASLSEAMEKWEENPMKKICKTCGKIIKDDEDYTLVNSGMPEEFVQCWPCHTSDMDNGKVLQCEACGEYFSTDVLHDEEVCGDSFCECPNCGKDIVEGLTKEEFEDEHFIPKYVVVVTFGNMTRGYQIAAHGTNEAMEKLLKHLGESGMNGVTAVHISEILLDEDIIS